MEKAIIEIFKIGTLPAILVYLMFNVDKLDKLIAFITRPFFFFWKLFSRVHIASKVSGYLNDFANNHIISLLPSVDKVVFKIKWVSSPEDPILEDDNTIIIRLKEDNDQTRNILYATKIALPQIVCPYIRNNIDKGFETSIDLAILKKLANMLGNNGKLIFKKHFLDIELLSNLKIQIYFKKLVEIDNRGYLIPILINELDYLGKGLYSDSDLSDVTDDIEKLLEFLIQLANWKKGDGIIPLNFYSKRINIGFILLAITERTITEGLRPYISRINKKFSQGSQSVYIIAEPEVDDFYKKLLNALESSDRFFLRKDVQIKPNSDSDKKKYSTVRCAILRKIDIAPDDAFQQKISCLDLKEGDVVSGEVFDVSEIQALITIKGIDSYIKVDSCSWNTVFSCHDYLQIGDVLDFIILKIDTVYSSIELTLKKSENDPWLQSKVPEVSEIVKATFMHRKNHHLICVSEKNIEICVLIKELSWFDLSESKINEFIGTEQFVKIISKDLPNRKLEASLRNMIDDPWPLLHKKYPKGTELNGKVIEINENCIRLDIGFGITGIIPKESMLLAGYEYQDFKNNVVIGQGFDVVVTKVFLEKKKIRLDLKRNIK